MKITADILNALKIETVYLLDDKNMYLCIPLEIRKMSWFVSCDSDNIQGNVKLKVKYRGSFLYLDAAVLKKENDTLYAFTYEVDIREEFNNKDKFKFYFLHAIREIEEKDTSWNKRKEDRYEIGLDEAKQKMIQFKSLEQTVVSDKVQLPCIINNISFNGAKITTMEGNFHKDKKVCILLNFVNPIEQIPIIANIRNCLIKSLNGQKNISILSVKFEHAPIEFKTRLDKYIELLEE